MGVGQGGGPSSNRGGYSGSNNSYFGGYGFGGPSRNLGLYSGGYHVNNSYGSNHPGSYGSGYVGFGSNFGNPHSSVPTGNWGMAQMARINAQRAAAARARANAKRAISGFHPGRNPELGGNQTRRHDLPVIHSATRNAIAQRRYQAAWLGAGIGLGIPAVIGRSIAAQRRDILSAHNNFMAARQRALTAARNAALLDHNLANPRLGGSPLRNAVKVTRAYGDAEAARNARNNALRMTRDLKQTFGQTLARNIRSGAGSVIGGLVSGGLLGRGASAQLTQSLAGRLSRGLLQSPGFGLARGMMTPGTAHALSGRPMPRPQQPKIRPAASRVTSFNARHAAIVHTVARSGSNHPSARPVPGRKPAPRRPVVYPNYAFVNAGHH